MVETLLKVSLLGFTPSIIISTCATIIASQVLISGSLIMPMNLNFWPRITVRQPSDSKGQIYIPINTLLFWLYFNNGLLQRKCIWKAQLLNHHYNDDDFVTIKLFYLL
jgi:hypothetical protein